MKVSKRAVSAIGALVCLGLMQSAFADDLTWKMKPQVAFANPDGVAENIQRECNLPQYQGEAIRAAAAAAGVPITFDDGTEPTSSPTVLQVQISSAISMGNAFLGHKKQMALVGYLYVNGEKRATFHKSRDSMGGFAAGFKSSCEVLDRCADTLAKDFVSWVQFQQGVVKAASAETSAPVANTN